MGWGRVGKIGIFAQQTDNQKERECEQ